jgi:gamma-glutamylcyclotransferase (GGCT)/AIG2-like uncharacterized protein YtfP
MKYIAYGSNMNQNQMGFRCSGAQLIGTGFLRGYQLEFNRHATIVKSNNSAATVPIAVWEITPEHEYRLDRYEGYPRYYRKIPCTVDMGTGEHIQGMAYQMCEFSFKPPDKYYFEGILEAYTSLGLRSQIKRSLLPALMRSHRLNQG